MFRIESYFILLFQVAFDLVLMFVRTLNVVLFVLVVSNYFGIFVRIKFVCGNCSYFKMSCYLIIISY